MIGDRAACVRNWGLIVVRASSLRLGLRKMQAGSPHHNQDIGRPKFLTQAGDRDGRKQLPAVGAAASGATSRRGRTARATALVLLAAALIATAACHREEFSPRKQVEQIMEPLRIGQYDKIYPLLSTMEPHFIKTDKDRPQDSSDEEYYFWKQSLEENLGHPIPEEVIAANPEAFKANYMMFIYFSGWRGSVSADQAEGETLTDYFLCERRCGNAAEAVYVRWVQGRSEGLSADPRPFIFIREGGSWKWSMSLSIDFMLHFSFKDLRWADDYSNLMQGSRPTNEPRSFTKYPVPEAVGRYYQKALQKAGNDQERLKLLQDWVKTGDPAPVEQYKEEFRKIMTQAGDTAKLETYLDQTLASPCDGGTLAGHGATTDPAKWLWQPDPAERLLQVALGSPEPIDEALKHFIALYPERPDLGALAQFKLYGLAWYKNPAGGMAALEELIRKYPDQTEIVTLAKHNLAKRYWDGFRFEDALRLWRELQAEGRLNSKIDPTRLAGASRWVFSDMPSEESYNTKVDPARLAEPVPRTVFVRWDDETKQEGVNKDFAFDAQGGVYVLRHKTETVKKTEAGKEKTSSLLHLVVEIHGPKGEGPTQVLDQPFPDPDPPDTIQAIDGRVFLAKDGLRVKSDSTASDGKSVGVTTGKLYLIEGGAVRALYLFRGVQLEPMAGFYAEGKNLPPPELTLSPEQLHLIFPVTSFYAQGPEFCSALSAAGITLFMSDQSCRLAATRLEALPGPERQWLAFPEKPKVVVKLNARGETVLFEDPQGPAPAPSENENEPGREKGKESRAWAPIDAMLDDQGNVVILDSSNHKLLVYSAAGQFSGEKSLVDFGKEASFSNCKLGPGPRLYMFVGGNHGFSQKLYALIGLDLIGLVAP